MLYQLFCGQKFDREGLIQKTKKVKKQKKIQKTKKVKINRK